MKIDEKFLDELIKRSERWIKDAEEREDWNDVSFYQGQLKAYVDMKYWIKD